MTLTVPELPDGCDTLRAALLYAAAGWFVLPIDAAGKHAGSVLGKRWQDQTSRDPAQIAAWFAGTAHGLALHVGRSGAVAFDVDVPDAVPSVLAEAIKTTQPPHQSTRTSVPGRGHYLFEVAAGSIGNSLGDLPAGWGEIRGLNGIIVVQPTSHEKAAEGGQYLWTGTGALPALPAGLGAMLRPPGSSAAPLGEPIVRDWVAGLSAGEPSAQVAAVPIAMPETGRHGEMNQRVMRLVRLAEQGHPGVPAALVALRDAFVVAVGEDRRHEFHRGLYGAVSEVLGNPTPSVNLPTDLEELAQHWWERNNSDPFVEPAAAPDEPNEAPDEPADVPPAASPVAARESRRVDLSPWLQGTWAPPQPSRGLAVDGRSQLLYPGRWHSIIGPTASGKSWAAVAHARAEIDAGRAVVYCHFEESLPGGTIARMLGAGMDPEAIRERFAWLDCDRAWDASEFAVEVTMVARDAGFEGVGLVILDGINAAVTRHGHDPSDVRAVGWYRATFVTPAARLGAAVLSLGHPPKARDRQDERHGIGSTAWLDEVDGVGFRLTPHRDHPVRKGKSGTAALYSVKDRYGEVEKHGEPDNREGWVYLGSLVVDDSGVGEHTSIRLVPPAKEAAEGERKPDEIDRLGNAIVAALGGMDGQKYDSERALADRLRAVGVTFAAVDLRPALERLEMDGRMEREPANGRSARPGWLTSVHPKSEVETSDAAA